MQSAAAVLAPVQAARRVLYVGSGNAKLADDTALFALFKDYDEVRLDICKEYKPDIVADMTNMGNIGAYDAVVGASSPGSRRTRAQRVSKSSGSGWIRHDLRS